MAAAPAPTSAQSNEPIKIGFSLALTGPLARRTASRRCSAPRSGKRRSMPRAACLAGKVELDQLRRSDQSGECARHLHEAARRRQSRSRHRALWHQPHGAGAAGRHAEGQDARSACSPRCKPGISLPEIFLHAAGRPEAKQAFTEGYFQVAAAAESKPQTVALTAEDAEFSRNACEGARENAKKFGFKIVYDKNLSARHDRLLANYSRTAGCQS